MASFSQRPRPGGPRSLGAWANTSLPRKTPGLAQTSFEPDEERKSMEREEAFSKVPAVTLIFWIIKILATTLGETGGDAVSMSMNLGYLVGTGIFAAIFAVAVIAQIRAQRLHPFLYWATIVATTTVG